MTQLQDVRLRAVVTEDFRRSEKTMFARWRKKNRSAQLRPADAVLFVSGIGNQLVFVFRSVTINNSEHKGNDEYEVTVSRKLRLDAGVWHPWMIEEYASELGLRTGLKPFADHFESWQERKRSRVARRRRRG